MINENISISKVAMDQVPFVAEIAQRSGPGPNEVVKPLAK
jgi:hypothetical protein